MPNIKQQDQSHEEHLTKAGEPDHRYKENRDEHEQHKSSGKQHGDDDGKFVYD